MPFWSGEKLEEELASCITTEGYGAENIDCASYTLHVGPEVFITPDSYEPNPSQNTKRKLAKDEAFNIPSGQFAFLLTEEAVSISDKCIAFISMKASTKFKGLVNVSGFHVDPGYKGRLVFSVFNAGPMPIKLQRGMPLFLMWLADLDRQTKKQKIHPPITDLDLKILDPIHGPIFSPQTISESVKSFKDDIKDEVHKVNNKVTGLIATVSILSTLVVGLVIFQINHSNGEVAKPSERKSTLDSEKSMSDTKNLDANKLPDKNKATDKAQ
ncbi:MAG: hypothetical protein K8F27_08050 [Sulfuricellaceae bacterium]|nr:hypothetical protein [Sulfuricellaceae bacterium]